MRAVALLAYLVTFSASFFIMVIELVAGRIMAPYVGQHLYSWTSIIGVCLAGISLGAFLGGWLADKFPHRATLGWILFFSGLLTLLIPIATDTVCGSVDLSDLLREHVTLMQRIVIYTVIIFLPSTVVLGMVSPMVIKLLIRDLSNAGSLVGRIYAFSTIGSIIGTFATGFILIEEFRTRLLLYIVGGALVIIAPLVGGLLGRVGKPAAGVLIGLLLALLTMSLIQPRLYTSIRERLKNTLGQPIAVRYDSDARWEYLSGRLGNLGIAPGSSLLKYIPPGFRIAYPFQHYVETRETNYYTIKVSQNWHTDPATNKEAECFDLILDNLVHSHSDPKDPTFLAYQYLRIYEELVDWQVLDREAKHNRQLFIGGGGYTMQRYFHHVYPHCHIDVAEIDPGVTQMAEKYMGIPVGDPRMVTVNVDGRLYVQDQLRQGIQYDFIFGDAFNDLSIPFHLTTKEFDEQLKALLSERGMLMSLVIDHVSEGLFLPSYLQTVTAVFGPENVALILTRGDEIPDLEKVKQDTVIVVASRSKLDWDDFERHLDERQDDGLSAASRIVRPKQVQEYLKNRKRQANFFERMLYGDKRIHWAPPILTDDYAPVDNLTAPMFEQRYGFIKR